MSTKTLASLAVLITVTLNQPVMAQSSNPQGDPATPERTQAMPPQGHYPAPPPLPSPRELARMVPPQPMTEDTIKAHFAKQREHIIAANERARKAAQKYAEDFARYQKMQSDRLVDLMARAEKRREDVLKRLQHSEQRALDSFRARQKDMNTQDKPAN